MKVRWKVERGRKEVGDVVKLGSIFGTLISGTSPRTCHTKKLKAVFLVSCCDEPTKEG